MTVQLESNKSSDTSPCDCCDELLIDYIDSFASDIARLRQDVREIVSEEIDKKLDRLDALIRQSRKPKPYIEVGYRGGS